MRFKFTPHHPGVGGCHNKLLFCPGDSDIAEPSLLLDLFIGVLRSDGHAARKESFLHSCHENDRKLQTFGRVERHEKNSVIAVIDSINVRDQGYFLQKAGQSRMLRFLAVGGSFRDQFVNVLKPLSGLFCVLHFKLFAIACVLQDLFYKILD